jgi:hypothetical protein
LHRITVNTAWTQKKRANRHFAAPLDEVGELAAPVDINNPEFAGEIAICVGD